MALLVPQFEYDQKWSEKKMSMPFELDLTFNSSTSNPNSKRSLLGTPAHEKHQKGVKWLS